MFQISPIYDKLKDLGLMIATFLSEASVSEWDRENVYGLWFVNENGRY